MVSPVHDAVPTLDIMISKAGKSKTDIIEPVGVPLQKSNTADIKARKTQKVARYYMSKVKGRYRSCEASISKINILADI